ncbi:DNA-binding protein [Cryobacterium algoritolerans]|uniref:DNA-binding protein n=1 Tax=Cryobacterium algoritolerans TaxID=1259184 RepID=A0A4R8WZ69_9MICO|nr:helix-turn-helix domain-containing protein [Cryobacterium algoritolerans]TFC20066.1 DNA-binding protein [Cryobacterium algoritolerans]
MSRLSNPYPATIEFLIREMVREEVRSALDREWIRILDRESINIGQGIVTRDPRQLYSVAAVADLLEMSKVWVYKQIREGKLPVVEFGDTRPHQRIRATDLEDFISDHMVRRGENTSGVTR